MGILNLTPDSFYAPSRTDASVHHAVEKAAQMIEEGASIIDVGGMSSRPGAIAIPAEEELERVLPVISTLHTQFPDLVISVDTYRSGIAREAIRAGATMVNDISGGELDADMYDLITTSPAAYVMLHMRGTPAEMQQHTDYDNLLSEVMAYFVGKLRTLHHLGKYDIVLDPGFGFSKTPDQNYQLINHLSVFQLLQCPLMVGISRKSTLALTIGRSVEETLAATTALHVVALQHGASILRVHDVQPAMDAIAVHNRLQSMNTLNNKKINQS
jgi:dihydropteroate synthase